MGQIVRITCSKCGFEKDIFSGGGRNDCNMDAILMALPDDEKQMLVDASEQGATKIVIDRKPCECRLCGEIYAAPVVTYTLMEAVCEIRGRCPNCGKQSQTPQINPPEKCPKCGDNVSLNFVGHWD